MHTVYNNFAQFGSALNEFEDFFATAATAQNKSEISEAAKKGRTSRAAACCHKKDFQKHPHSADKSGSSPSICMCVCV